MATATAKKTNRKPAAKKTKVTKAATKRTRPLLTPAELKEAEAELRKQYPNIIKGSLRNRGEREGYGPKRTVEIKCATRGCKNTRVVATSDLHQVAYCETCTHEMRLVKKQAARRAANPK